jgi:hypothetical protein
MVRMDFRGRDGKMGKPVSTGGRLGLTLFLFFFFAMGSLFELFIVREFGRAAGQRTWTKVPCRIVGGTVQGEITRNRPCFRGQLSVRVSGDGPHGLRL